MGYASDYSDCLVQFGLYLFDNVVTTERCRYSHIEGIISIRFADIEHFRRSGAS